MTEHVAPAGVGLVDLHNHLMPGVDDGASTVNESRAALAAMQDAGVTSLIVTPHLRGSLTLEPRALEARLRELDEGWSRLKALASAEFPTIHLERGVELMLDTPAPDISDPRLRLAGGEFVLLEFPFMVVPPHSVHAIAELRMQGWKPVIAHPERYSGVDDRLEIVSEWRRCGGILQVNTGSLVGRYGEGAKRRAEALLERGWVDLLASDYHARGQLTLTAARAKLTEIGADQEARQLLMTNPGKIFQGEEPLPVQPLTFEHTLWERLRKVFR